MGLRIKLAWRRKRPSYLFGNPKIDLRFKMIAMSGASAGLAVIARAMSEFEFFGRGWAAVLVIAGAVLGALVLATLAHRFLKRHFAAFKAAEFLGFGAFALATFIAHGQAVGEVNAIFQIDASALPHATAAASAMVIGAWLYWSALLPLAAASAIWAVRCLVKSQYGDATISLAIFLASVTWSGLIGHQAAPDLRRKSNIYRIALEMDFNKRSHCVGMPPGAEGVAFIGLDQRRAIVAPRKAPIPSRGGFSALVPQVEAPSEFQLYFILYPRVKVKLTNEVSRCAQRCGGEHQGDGVHQLLASAWRRRGRPAPDHPTGTALTAPAGRRSSEGLNPAVIPQQEIDLRSWGE